MRWLRRIWCWLTATDYVISIEGCSPASVRATAQAFAAHFAHYQVSAWVTVLEDGIIIRCTDRDAQRFL